MGRFAQAQRSPMAPKKSRTHGLATPRIRNTSEASQALLRARNFPEMLEVQTRLLRNNLQTFLEQGARVAEAASRMAMPSFQAFRQTRQEQKPWHAMPQK